MAKRTASPAGVPAHLPPRHARIRSALLSKRLDGIILTTPADLGYVTGVAWEDTWGVLTHNRLTLISDFRYQTHLAELSGWARRYIRKTTQSLADALADVVIGEKLQRVGFEPAWISVASFRLAQTQLRKHARRGKPPAMVPVRELMLNQRKVKDAFEIAAIRRAVDVAEGAYGAVRPELRAGMTENEIAGRMEFEMRRRGASSGSFETDVGVGANTALPHYRPGAVPLQAGKALLFDWGAKVDYYCSDITRTHLFGRPDPKMREIYQVTLEAQLAAISAIRPGVSNRSVDKVARDIIRKAGYGKHFGHSLGHGIGLAVHEMPRLGPSAAEETLQPGMIVTVEPGIYLAGVGGVRIEDDVLVTDRGCEVLTSLDTSYEGACLE